MPVDVIARFIASLSGSPRLLDRLLVQPLPRHERADEEGHAARGDGEGEGDLDARHVGDEDAGDLIGGEDAADVGRAREEELLRVDSRGAGDDTVEEAVDEARLGGGDGEGAADGLEDWGRVLAGAGRDVGEREGLTENDGCGG